MFRRGGSSSGRQVIVSLIPTSVQTRLPQLGVDLLHAKQRRREPAGYGGTGSLQTETPAMIDLTDK